MDVRTPTLIALCSMLAAVTLSVLGLTADNIAYLNDHRDDTVHLHYLRWNQTAEATYPYWVQIDHMPSRFSVKRIIAMLGASIVAALAAIGVASVSWVMRNDNLNSKNRKRSMQILLVGLFPFIAFAISFGAAIYAWYPSMQWDINFERSLPFPPSVTGANAKTVKYEAPYEIGPDLWYCWISDYTVDPAAGGRLRTLCKESHIAKILMLPMVVLSGILVVGVGLVWWMSKRAIASKTETIEIDTEEINI